MKLEDFIKSLPSKAGVYQFYVYSLEKYYIGESVNIRRRVKEHLKGWGKRELGILVKNYDLDNLGFQILSLEKDRQVRLDLENHYKTYYGYSNLLNSFVGKESITPDTSKEIVVFDFEGCCLGIWKNSVEASQDLGVSTASLRLAASGNRKTARNLFCFYTNEETDLYEALDKKLNYIKEKKKYLYQKAIKNGEFCKKPVLAKLKDIEYIFMSVKDAATYFDIKSANVSACCLGKLKTYKNYEWSYLNV